MVCNMQIVNPETRWLPFITWHFLPMRVMRATVPSATNWTASTPQPRHTPLFHHPPQLEPKSADFHGRQGQHQATSSNHQRQPIHLCLNPTPQPPNSHQAPTAAQDESTRLIGYFALMQLLRMHSLLGDYRLAMVTRFAWGDLVKGTSEQLRLHQ